MENNGVNWCHFSSTKPYKSKYRTTFNVHILFIFKTHLLYLPLCHALSLLYCVVLCSKISSSTFVVNRSPTDTLAHNHIWHIHFWRNIQVNVCCTFSVLVEKYCNTFWRRRMIITTIITKCRTGWFGKGYECEFSSMSTYLSFQHSNPKLFSSK